MTRSLVTFLLVSAAVLSPAPLALAASEALQAAQPASPAIGNRALNQLVATSPEHRKTLVALLRGRRDLPDWVRSIITNARYVTGVSRMVNLPEGQFELFGACDPRNCPNSHMRILFSPDGTKAWARLVDPKDGQQVLGEPSADQLQTLMAPGI